MLFPPPKKKK